MSHLVQNAADILALIPLRQLADIFIDWLALEDIGKFDSAACNSTLRKVYLDLIQEDCFIYSNDDDGYDRDDEFYQWSINRRFRVTLLIISEKMFTDHSFRHQYLQMTGRVLKSMDFCYTNVDDIDADNEELAANYIATTQQIIYDLADHCPLLESLSMHEYVLDGTFCLLLTKCTCLQKLDISRCLGISSSILRSICSLPNLKELDVECCTFLPNAFDFRHTPCLSLQKLVTSYSSPLSPNQSTLTSMFPKVLDITMTSLDRPSLLGIVKSCPLVQIAQLSVVHTLLDADVDIIAGSWKNITQLKLTNARVESRSARAMSEGAMLNIITKCLQLQSLVLRDCHSVFHHSLNCTSPAVPQNTVKSALQILLCESISAATLSAIVSKCPDLHKLWILQPSIRVAQGQSAVYPLHLLKGTAVKSLKLMNCALVPACLDTVEDLEELVFEGCTGLTDATLASAAQRCPHLNGLIIKNCPLLTATALIEMIGHCSELKTLSFLTHGNEEQSYFTPHTPMQKLVEALVRKQCPKMGNICVN